MNPARPHTGPLGTSIESTPMPLRMRRVIIAEPVEAVRLALSANFRPPYFLAAAYEEGSSAYRDFVKAGADLVLLSRTLPGMGSREFCERVRETPAGDVVAIVLVGAAYRDPYVGAGECKQFGADTFIPLPASSDLVWSRLEAAMARREPVERLNVLPTELAQRIDRLFNSYEKLDYYDLLEVGKQASRSEIQQQFHQLSLLLHPDRHARLRETQPSAFDRVSAVFKRISEGYRVLIDDSARRAYNLGLRKGMLRANEGAEGEVQHRELAACGSDAARHHVLESLECRSLGDLDGALAAMGQAVAVEPGNELLRLTFGALEKLVQIVQRDG